MPPLPLTIATIKFQLLPPLHTCYCHYPFAAAAVAVVDVVAAVAVVDVVAVVALVAVVSVVAVVVVAASVAADVAAICCYMLLWGKAMTTIEFCEKSTPAKDGASKSYDSV